MTPQQLTSFLEEFAKANQENAYLVVSRTEPPLPLEQVFPDGSSVEWLCHVYSAEDIVAVERADLSVVFDQIEHMEKADGVQLLSRLRDQHSRRVLLHCSDQAHSNQELLALGYIEQKRPSIDGRFFLFDPDLFFERRDWNTPARWANPENFKKYRW
jgi:hypothetical protein